MKLVDIADLKSAASVKGAYRFDPGLGHQLVAALLTLLCASSAAWAQTAAVSQASFASCIEQLRPAARSAGVSDAHYLEYTRELTPDPSVLEKLDHQPEFKTPIWDYMAALVDQERIDEGRARLREHQALLDRLQARFGVDPATIVAVWGVESNYGQSLGRYPLLQALGTLSCYGRRQSFFRGEWFAAMRILQSGDVRRERLLGSWAGAFGQTQFMPSTYERLAVDGDGDGRRDLIDNTADALASTANFLAKAGWKSGLSWGFEVRLPAGFTHQGEGRRQKRPIAEWQARGVRRVDGSALPEDAGPTGLLIPAGPEGPAFLVTRNFDALYSYNAAESYGLAIAHLSDRLRGGKAFSTAWPTDDPGLSRAERRELQTLLKRRGHDIGEIDGLLGERSRAAIRAEQTRLGWRVDGRAGQKLLRELTRSN